MTPDTAGTAQASPSPSVPPATAGNRAGTGGNSEFDPLPPRRWPLVLVLVLAVVGLALLVAFFGAVRHWVALRTGTLHGGPDVYYNFWSGFGSDLGEATLISAVAIGVYTGVRKVNCHTKGCWRIGHHQLDGTPYVLCRHHHPDVPSQGASHAHILDQHRRYKEAHEGPR